MHNYDVNTHTFFFCIQHEYNIAWWVMCGNGLRAAMRKRKRSGEAVTLTPSTDQPTMHSEVSNPKPVSIKPGPLLYIGNFFFSEYSICIYMLCLSSFFTPAGKS
jgi:hypothetical protein